jgi:hypothetical protein
VPNRNRLGLDTAQKLIFVQQNDPTKRTVCELDTLMEWCQSAANYLVMRCREGRDDV